ncbi:hypothetical protein BV22DRAFT_338231 [Leucogyrophana mollusca]|uniref:Uncharacterized protein n=1 Tax=Leucogyrophana mollusca TaxID=85980 RepID=A0ACB8BLM5_9AGAM|nr:hypothetical protein BV22DRAFT_338231 [Leucogyrophana mollusca]
MPVSIDIIPFSDSLDMYGEADPSSAFSLAGHVSVSLTSSPSMFQRRRSTTRIMLQSLTVTFEGQSEVITPEIAYAPLRLCSITRELVHGEPVDLSNEGHEDSDKPCSWNVIFDIQVPGWLPTTSVYGDSASEEIGTRYALYATATFVYLEDPSSRSFSISTLCAPFRYKTRSAHAPRCPITLNRFTDSPAVPSSSTSLFPMSVYLVDAQRQQNEAPAASPIIPPEVLKKVQVVASIPSAVTTDEATLPFTLRLRAKDMDDSHRDRLRVTGFSIDVEQIETYRSSASRERGSRFPVPPRSNQPPKAPLRLAHSAHTLLNVGLLTTPLPPKPTTERAFSLLPPQESGRYNISGDGYVFKRDAPTSTPPPAEENWYILETSVPLSREAYQLDWCGPRSRRTSENSPLFGVQHFMYVSVQCVYDLEGEGPVTERLQFSLPMRFVRVQAEAPVPCDGAAPGSDPGVGLQKSAPYAQSLPAYSQLFHSNGERKIDYSIPLPLYEPPSPSSATSSSFSLGDSEDEYTP